jgi:hypothetical protein
MKEEKIKAELKRYTHSGQDAIRVVYPDGNEDDLWEGLIEFCLRRYSTNEIIKIAEDCKKQINAMDPDDVPFIWNKMMDELHQAMINRGIYRKAPAFGDEELEVKNE